MNATKFYTMLKVNQALIIRIDCMNVIDCAAVKIITRKNGSDWRGDQ